MDGTNHDDKSTKPETVVYDPRDDEGQGSAGPAMLGLCFLFMLFCIAASNQRVEPQPTCHPKQICQVEQQPVKK